MLCADVRSYKKVSTWCQTYNGKAKSLVNFKVTHNFEFMSDKTYSTYDCVILFNADNTSREEIEAQRDFIEHYFSSPICITEGCSGL